MFARTRADMYLLCALSVLCGKFLQMFAVEAEMKTDLNRTTEAIIGAAIEGR